MTNAAIRELRERLAFAHKNLIAWNKRARVAAKVTKFHANEHASMVQRIEGIEREIADLEAAVVLLEEQETDNLGDEK